MKISKVILIVLSALLVLILAGWLVWRSFFAPPTFHAVSLVTGDVYFGQLVRFPSFGLKQVYTIQVNPQNEENPLSIQRFQNIFWGPEDFIKINRNNVAWTVKLDSRGQLAQLLRSNPDLLPGPGVQQQQQAPPANAALGVPEGIPQELE